MEQEQDIIEGNKIIAEFDGRYTTDLAQWVDTATRLVRDYEYHSSWDWLMPVVEKIESLRYQVKQCRRKVEIWKDTSNGHSVTMPSTDILFSAKEETKLKSTWLAVVEFIKWYNQNK